MKFSRSDADVFAPDGTPPAQALARTTHLCIGAHQDDIEIMAYAGISDCLGNQDLFFTGVVATNGAGSPRTGRYAAFTDEQMQAVRREEQRRAATIGKYNLQLQLGHPSAAVKDPAAAEVRADLAAIFGGCAPQVVYLHNPADKHDTHIAVLHRCLEAIRSLPRHRRPRRVLGCEVWRDLDWVVDADKVALNSGRNPQLAEALIKVFDSQISGGKRYDRAVLGRRVANATYHQHHEVDAFEGVTWSIDLTPLAADDALSMEEFTLGYVERLRADIASRIGAFAVKRSHPGL